MIPGRGRSYAQVAAHNAPPPSEQPHPDVSLLQTADSSTASLTPSEHSTINLIDASEAASLRSSIDPDSTQEHDVSSADFAAAKRQTDAAQAAVPTAHASQAELQQRAAAAEKKLEQLARDGKKKAGEWEKSAERKGREWEKKAADKASEWERDGKEFASKYPAAATGIVGLVNLAIIGVVGAVAYSNWDQPRWDRRTVSAISVGLLGVFGAQGYLGYYEYEKEHSK